MCASFTERHLAERHRKGNVANHSALEMNSEIRSEDPRAVVGATQALVVETVKLLSRNCPDSLLGEAAREDLLALRPHLQEALEALDDIKRLRSLTEEELNQQYAFKMLLAYRG
jgi:hypothetical protein